MTVVQAQQVLWTMQTMKCGMHYAIKKLNHSEFQNAFSLANVRVKEYDSKSSPGPPRGRSYSWSRSRSRSMSKSPKAKSMRHSPVRSMSRLASSHSGSRPQSLSRYGYMEQTGDWIIVS